MTLYTLVILACLPGDLSKCRFEKERLYASAMPTTAFIEAQTYVAQWAQRHPAVEIVRWRMIAGEGA
jgi:hypothetical protein